MDGKLECVELQMPVEKFKLRTLNCSTLVDIRDDEFRIKNQNPAIRLLL